MKRRSQKVSAGEMEILSMLWRQGSLSLSEAHEAVGRPIGYTTVQTRLNRLVKKGLVTRSDSRPARYDAAISREDISANHLNVLLERVTGGSVVPLVAHLVNDRSLSRQDLGELKKIIHEADQGLSGPKEES